MTRGLSTYHYRGWGLTAPDRGDDWRDRAACTRRPAEWWDLIGHKLTEQNRWAREICRTCPVRAECDQFAVASGATGVILAGHPPTPPTLAPDRNRRALSPPGSTPPRA